MSADHRTKEHFVAVLIDSDNAMPSKLEATLDEVVKFGRVTIRRAYGDWTTQSMVSWKKLLQEHAIHPVQQFRNTVGKNASDSAMIIDIMDILHREEIDVFCLVSSDSDFTRLATRLRESGKIVVGIGKKTTPRSFQNGCNRFIYTENLKGTKPEPRKRAPRKTTTSSSSSTSTATAARKTTTRKSAEPSDPVPLIKRAFDVASEESFVILLSELGSALRSIDPSFDSRSYGKEKLVDLIRALPNEFQIETKKDQPFTIYIRRS
jgi:uncharacterized protein (TIGR00288 family)